MKLIENPQSAIEGPKARSTPTVDGNLIYALGSDGDLACLEAANGKIRWQKNIRKEFGGQPGEWAYAESPLVGGDVVFNQPKHKQVGTYLEQAYAHPVIANCRLYIRDLGTLWVYDIKEKR